jgi:hypothetical protein
MSLSCDICSYFLHIYIIPCILNWITSVFLITFVVIFVWASVTKVKRSLRMFVISLIRVWYNHTASCWNWFWCWSIVLEADLDWSIGDLIYLSLLMTWSIVLDAYLDWSIGDLIYLRLLMTWSIVYDAYLDWSISDLIYFRRLMTICFLVRVFNAVLLCNDLKLVVLLFISITGLVFTLRHWML